MIEMVMEPFNFLSQMSVEKMRMRLLCLFPKEVKIPQRGDYLCFVKTRNNVQGWFLLL